MNLWQSIRVSLRALTANKLRSILTMLGIIIGVAAVIALLSIGQGVQEAVIEQIQSAGSNLITIIPGTINISSSRVATTGQSQGVLTLEDAEALSDPQRAPSIVAVAPATSNGGQVVFGGQTVNAQIAGVTPDYLIVYNLTVASGDFVDRSDVDGMSRVVVLGARVAETLFGEDDPVGQVVKINRSNFRVIGVLAAKGGSSFGSADTRVFVPITTAQRRLFGSNRPAGSGQRVSNISISAASENLVDQAISEVTEILRERHKISFQDDDFTVFSQKDILGIFNQITGFLTAFLAAIAAISLLVGGIGIMNIMLVSVTERTREIGIRKAVGARWRDILIQFLVEAVVLSILGGIGGIALGWLMSQAVNALKVGEPQPLVTIVSLNAVALAVGFSVAVGLFFGIYPASRAASLNPIEALRYE